MDTTYATHRHHERGPDHHPGDRAERNRAAPRLQSPDRPALGSGGAHALGRIAGTFAITAAATLSALDVAVDQGWGPRTSSHDLHAIWGAMMGSGGYAGLRVLGCERRPAVIASIAIGSTIGLLYEIKNDRQGQDSFADPADALYTAAGVVIGTAVVYGTDRFVLTPIITPNSGSLALLWRIQ